MNKNLRQLVLQIFFCLITTLGAPILLMAQQVDTAISLKSVEIFENRWNTFSTGTKSKKIDNNILTLPTTNLSEALNQSGLFFQRTYGLGSLATSGLRGGAANHTTLLWNGFNINSPFNGLMDLSLIPFNFFSSVDINYGGSADLWGTGAIAGNIHLQNDLSLAKGVNGSVGFGLTSFGGFNQNLTLQLADGKQALGLSVINQTAENDFEYLNGFNNQTQSLSNASLSNTGIQLNYKNQLSKVLVIQTGIWAQATKREIPPSFTQASSAAFQEDKTYRGFVSATGYLKGFKLTGRTAFFWEDLYFEDALTNIYSENSAAKSVSEFDVSKTFGQYEAHLGLNYTYEQGNSGNYQALISQTNPSIFGGYKYQTKKNNLKISANFRQARFNNSWIPFVYGLGAEYAPFEKLSISANHSKVYRIPTINDRFWNPGGNPNLLPEEGFSSEVTFDLHELKASKNIEFNHQTTLFTRNITNWIIWLPTGGLWSPQNIQEVWSRGVETHSEVILKMQESTLMLWLNTNYILSTNEKSKTVNDASLHKQLIYTPIYQVAGGISFARKGAKFFWQTQYTGYSFTASDHSDYLAPFYLSQLGISGLLKIKSQKFEITATVQNIFNKNYQVVANRPMPPRNFQLNFNYKFAKS